MKIVHIITSLHTGGAERALYNLLQGGLNSKFENHVISLSDKGTIGPQIEALGVPVITLDMPIGRPTLAGIIKLQKIIKEMKPDLVQGWMYHGNLASILARFFSSNKTALIWGVRHSLYEIRDEKRLTQLVIIANRFLSKLPEKILYNSKISQQQHEQFGFNTGSGDTIPNGINLKQFQFSEVKRLRIRAEFNIPENAPVAGHVARFHPVKNHALFLRAAVNIAQRYADFHCLLIGRDVSLENEDLTKHIPKNLQSRFHMLGEWPDVAGVMSAMDVLVQTSLGEAFPNVLGEAMAIGLPCVATDVGDSALIIGDCGEIVASKDQSALVTGIESLLTLSLAKRQLLRQQARQRIQENFSLDSITEQYTKLYQSVILEARQK